jgi:hypothetical protein
MNDRALLVRGICITIVLLAAIGIGMGVPYIPHISYLLR